MKSSRLLLMIILLLLGAATILFANRTTPQNNSPANTQEKEQDIIKPIIVTTLFPFYDTTSKLVEGKAEVSLLLPPGVEPHSFEPTPQDIIKIQEADIFIYTGDIMEPWVKDIVANIPESVKIINASEDIALIESKDDDHGHEDEEKENKSGSNLDPHFWLDFNNSIIATNTISRAISALNIVDNNNLEQNTKSIITSLEQLDTDYTTTLASCKNKTILQAGHRTFEYLSRKYNLNYITTEELSPNSDTSAQDISKLVKEVRETRAKAIFSEELIEPRIANTIASETGVPVLELNGAHNISAEQFKSKISFVDIMKQNLENLSIGLECK
ncbi:MAG: metal ABC transporter solute-binding protein, Zn/Mn family [Minisyncoccia bacterium]